MVEFDSDEDSTSWRPVARARTYELVIDRVEEQILTGGLRVGDRLPAERDLAKMLDVSRAAVREAFRALEAQGVLRMGVGTGPDSGTTVAALPSPALTRLLRLHVALANFPVADVVRARIMLERESARRAAARARAEDLERLGELLDAMDDPDCDRQRFNDLDTEFHVRIAEAGGNRLVADMTIAIRESMRKPLLEVFDRLGDDWFAIADDLRADHRSIYRALLDGDADGAESCTEAHIRSFYRHGWADEL
ncbi:FCD domain-containing protein [Saccharopolyspora halophila]|uniref:FCD domain-containing protein n=1 Tax=Saccharopolyspora halophila TaxID=405551 RepID=A0ABP5TL33_9PSEU